MRKAMLFLIAGMLTRAQSPALAFEVASIRPTAPDHGPSSAIQFPGGGRMNIYAEPLKTMLRFAYGLRDSQIEGGPGWTGSQLFDVVAKAQGAPAAAEMKLMLRELLKDRFKLALRQETRDVPIYNLVIAKNGPKMAESSKPDGFLSGRGPGVVDGQKTTMAQLANLLTVQLGQRVVDMTGLTKSYDFALRWTPDESQKGLPGGPDANTPLDPSGPSIFTALSEQLGVKLESAKGPMDFLVIERAEKPVD